MITRSTIAAILTFPAAFSLWENVLDTQPWKWFKSAITGCHAYFNGTGVSENDSKYHIFSLLTHRNQWIMWSFDIRCLSVSKNLFLVWHTPNFVDMIIVMCKLHAWTWQLILYVIKVLFPICSWQDVLHTTLCNKACQWLATGQWFSPCILVSSTNKTDNHDIAEILLKVSLNTVNHMS